MKYNEIFEILNEVLKAKPTQTEIAEILGTNQSTIANRARRNSDFKMDEIEKIESHYEIRFVRGMGGNYTAFRTCEDENSKIEAHRLVEQFINNIENKKNTSVCPSCDGQIDVPYLECLPEEAKLPEIPSIRVDIKLVVNHWLRKPENLRIIPMQGDSLSSYIYPINNRDVLMIDINSKVPTREGIYAYSAKNNTLFFVAKLSQNMDGTIKIEKFEKNGDVTSKSITPEEQKEVDFKVIGRVVKNVTWTL